MASSPPLFRKRGIVPWGHRPVSGFLPWLTLTKEGHCGKGGLLRPRPTGRGQPGGGLSRSHLIIRSPYDEDLRIPPAGRESPSS